MKKAAGFSILFFLVVLFSVPPLGLTAASLEDETVCSEILATADPYLLLFQQDGEDSLLVAGGANPRAVMFDSQGIILSSFSLGDGLLTAKQFGRSVYTFSDAGNRILAEEYDLDSGEILCSYEIPASPSRITFISCDGQGNSYLVTSDQPSVLLKYGPAGQLACYYLEGEISFLDVWDDTVWLYQDGFLLRFHTDETPDQRERVSTPYIPAKVLDSDLYVEVEGGFCRSDGSLLLETGIRPDVSSAPLPVKQLHCSDENGNLYYASANSELIVEDYWGDMTGAYPLDGMVVGVNANGALLYEEGFLLYAPYRLLPQEDPPEESTSLPEGILAVGSYLLVNQGKTVSAMGELLGTDLYLDGEKVTSGLCRTGMEVEYQQENYILCVMGDVNGTGTVNSADIRLVQKHLTGESLLDGAFAFAADISRNGSIGCEDLALISALFSL